MNKSPIFSLLLICLSIATTFAQNPEIKWWFNTDDSCFGSAAAADMDGDGFLEIIFGCYRNDSMVYVLNAEDGSLAWKQNLRGDFEGCNDTAPIIYDVDQDGDLEAVVPASCNPTTFCFDGATGAILWQTALHGSDSPPTVSDLNKDGKPEILHGNFGGTVTCLNAEDGSIVFDLMVDPTSWIQTAPTILDADNDGNLDFFVAASSFNGPDRFFCYRADNQQLLWESSVATDDFYHGASVADLDGDGLMELVIGCYDGSIYTLNAEDGSLAWSYALPDFFYTPMPTSIADLNQDGHYEIIFFDFNQVVALSHDGQFIWEFEIPGIGQSFRGAAISDVTGEGQLDVVFASDNGVLYALHGADGSLAFEVDLAAHYGDSRFQLDHGPVIADFDHDGYMDIFVVGGHTLFPEFENNFGRAYAVSTNATGGPDWLMFRRDSVRSGHIPLDITNSTDEKTTASFILAPNPATESIFISATNKSKMSIANINGAILLKRDDFFQEHIDVSSFAKGIYIVTLTNNIGTASKKIIVR